MWPSLRSTVLWLTGEIVQCLKSMEGFPEEKAELCLERQIISSVGDGRRNSKVVLGGKELKSRVSSNTWALGYLFGPRQSSGKGRDIFTEVPYSLAGPFNISTSYGCRYPGPLLTLFNPHFSKCEYCFSTMPPNSPLAQTFRTTINCLIGPCLACLPYC